MKSRRRGQPFEPGNHLGRKFQPGVSPNPGGRPRLGQEMREAAQLHGVAAVEVLVALLDHDRPEIRLRAAAEILDRGYGRPRMELEITEPVDRELADDGRRVTVTVDLDALTDAEVWQLRGLVAHSCGGRDPATEMLTGDEAFVFMPVPETPLPSNDPGPGR